MNGAGRKIERVRMPLEHVLVAAEVSAQRVAFCRGRGMQSVPANLAHIVRPHVGAQRRGQQLRAQADSEDGNAARQRVLDGRDLGG